MTDDSRETLRPPLRTGLGDPGANELESSDSEDQFSDARTGLGDQSSLSSPILPIMVEQPEIAPNHGGKLSIDTHHERAADALVERVGRMAEDDERMASNSVSSRPTTPGGYPIPITVVEKVDPSTPSYGEIPGTLAHELRKADAVPDLVLKTGTGRSTPVQNSRSRASSTPGDLPIPITKVEKVDMRPSHGEVPGTVAYEMRKSDAQPDVVEEVGDFEGSPTSSFARSTTLDPKRRESFPSAKDDLNTDLGSKSVEYNEEEDGNEEVDEVADEDADFGDDFDEFEEGGEDAEFGDFDDGFQEEALVKSPPLQPFPIAPSFPVLNFDELDSPSEILAATEPYINALFPPDSMPTKTLPRPSSENPIFLTERSASLWSQLVAPPPLQPPNWIRSRIRRLFLVSLGVPIDLDEILPASKQKKLILPSTMSPRNSTSISRLKQSDGNASSTSLDSQGKPTHSKRRKGPLPAPELDLVYARQLCGVTDEALTGMTGEELKEHVAKLEAMQGLAEEALQYWTKKTDEKIGDREAFEGVIENLVKHARKVRK